MNKPKLYSYFRSSASYRVRIVLNLKNIDHELVYINLREGEQSSPAYKAISPQGFVPALEIGGKVLTQSLAIIDYLERFSFTPSLYPADPMVRARVLELAYIIAQDIHPLNNLRILKYLTNELKTDEDDNLRWYKHWVHEGLKVFEQRVKQNGLEGRFCYGDEITLADICLVPQIYNALRFGCDISDYKSLMRIYESCLALSAFKLAQPESQKDAV